MSFELPELFISPFGTWGPPEDAGPMTIDELPFECFSHVNAELSPIPLSAVPTKEEEEARKKDSKGFQQIKDTARLMAVQNERAQYRTKKPQPRNPAGAASAAKGKQKPRAKRIAAPLPNTLGNREFDPLVVLPMLDIRKHHLSEDVVVEQLSDRNRLCLFNSKISEQLGRLPENGKLEPKPELLSDDKYVSELMRSIQTPNPIVFATDRVLSLLMAATATKNPWHFSTLKMGRLHFLYADSERDGNVDKQWVSETAQRDFKLSETDERESERISRLGEESNRVHEAFLQACCSKTMSNRKTEPSRMSETRTGRMYRYRRYTLHKGTPQEYDVVVRSEVDCGVMFKGELQLARVFGLLERLHYEEKKKGKDHTVVVPVSKWRGNQVLLNNEYPDNMAKMLRWMAMSMLSDARLLKIGLITRRISPDGATSNPKEHDLLAVQTIERPTLMSSVQLRDIDLWATADAILMPLFKVDQKGELCIVRLNNTDSITIATRIRDADDSESESEEEEEEEEESEDEDDE